VDADALNHAGLLVGTWPPRRCGIAAYNEQMRRAEDWSPFDASPERPLSFRLGSFLRAVRGHRTVRISFDPYALACGSFQALWTYPLLIALQRVRRVEIVVHEPWAPVAYGFPAANALYRAFCRRAAWRVHVPSQVAPLEAAFGAGLSVEPLPHGNHFRRAYEGDREQARVELGIAATEAWLCIGFVAAAKGFSDFSRAFVGLPANGSRLFVVGSVRAPKSADLGEAEALRVLSTGSDGRMEFHESFVDDAEFDRWIAASDVVVLPYRETSTSGVVERARLFGKVVLVRDLPGLREAVAGDSRGVVYTDDAFEDGVARVRSLLAAERG